MVTKKNSISNLKVGDKDDLGFQRYPYGYLLTMESMKHRRTNWTINDQLSLHLTSFSIFKYFLIFLQITTPTLNYHTYYTHLLHYHTIPSFVLGYSFELTFVFHSASIFSFFMATSWPQRALIRPKMNSTRPI